MSSDEVPPPYSEQELDQKISQALVISAQQPQSNTQDSTADGEWEQWNEEVFAAAEANNRRVQDGGSSGSYLYASASHELPVPSAVAPLRIRKQRSSNASAGWSENVDHNGSVGSPGSSSSGHALSVWNASRTHHDIPLDSDDDDDDDRSVPPPPFTSMGPRADGIIRLEYHPESTPPSPLNSPVPEHRPSLPPPDPPFPFHQPHASANPRPQPQVLQKPPRQSLPIPPRASNYHLEQRPMSTFHPRQSIPRPAPIQPSVTLPPRNLRQPTIPPQHQTPTQTVSLSALSKVDQIPSTITQTQSFTVGSLYNSSVSAHLSSSMSMQPRESYSSRPRRLSHSTQPQVPQPGSFHMGHHPIVLGAPSVSTLPAPMSQAPPGLPSNTNSLNGSHVTQYAPQPTHQHTPPRWATSEQQYNQNFRH